MILLSYDDLGHSINHYEHKCMIRYTSTFLIGQHVCTLKRIFIYLIIILNNMLSVYTVDGVNSSVHRLVIFKCVKNESGVKFQVTGQHRVISSAIVYDDRLITQIIQNKHFRRNDLRNVQY